MYPIHVPSQATALEMIHDIREAFNELLEHNEWMDDETRSVAKGRYLYDVREIFGFLDPLPLVMYRNQLIVFLLSVFWGFPNQVQTSYKYGPQGQGQQHERAHRLPGVHHQQDQARGRLLKGQDITGWLYRF